MAVVDQRRERCDGCGRAVALENLSTVTMPDGERLACCPTCAPHAREAARKLESIDRPRGTCDGCRSSVPRNDLEDVVLTDGTVITCCSDCLEEVPGHGEAGTSESDGLDDGTGASVNEAMETTELATRRTLCSQCHEYVDEELYHVTTIDGRTEELCSDCKALAEEKGVVSGVKMRKSEAREILRVGDDVTNQELREAFLTQIKHAHPDKKSGSESAFKLVKEAYDRLK
ncbi:J domain-containing protein [Natronosalvus rutilus]|uniref:J domain-containing protein n=1 Tax=Natronosalvus rutilus TaxID=2953753 RepID=A0A9E7N7K3_9EURY|nr:J domain-containing protein [Natronosalvus rutilus]UTF52950.1 J domain-containing protein [Natronosalvus rutilus]